MDSLVWAAKDTGVSSGGGGNASGRNASPPSFLPLPIARRDEEKSRNSERRGDGWWRNSTGVPNTIDDRAVTIPDDA